MEPGDETILARIRAGDRNQYSLLVERYQGKGMSLAIGILKNSSDAEEALQDAFVRAWRGLDKFEGISGFGTWFYRILYNVCMTAASRRRIQRPGLGAGPGPAHGRDGRADGDLALPEPEADGTPDTEYEQINVAESVRKAVAALPGAYAAIVTMFYLQEMSVTEISAVAGITEGAVKTRLFRGRLLLQKQLAPEFAPERSLA